MFKPLFKTLVAVLAIAAAATGPAWGQNASPDVTLDFTTNDWGLPAGKTNITYAANSYTSGDYTITLQGGGGSSNGYYFNSGYLMLGKSGAYLELPEFESAVDSIVVVGNSAASANVLQNIYVGGTAVSTQTTGATGTNTYVINEYYRASGNIYTLKVENAYNTQITYIKVYYVSSGGGSGSETPTPGQNSTTYNVTFGGFSESEMNTTVNVTSLPQTFTQIGNDALYPWTVISTSGNIFYGATVTSGGEGKVSVSVPNSDEMSITVTGPFEGTATIHVTGEDDENRDISCDITVSCVSNAPAAPTPHTVRFASGNDGWTVTDVDSARSATAPAVLQNVMAGDSLVVTAPASLDRKVKSVKAVKFVAVQSIVLDKQTAYLAKDSTMTLSVASVLPENAADKSYTWSSDNTSVATVNATTGVVTGMAAGTANIIATANDGSGVKDTCVVTVLNSVILDGVTVLYASDNDRWSTITGYNPGVLYLDGDYVRLTSNGASLFYDGDVVHSIDFIYSTIDVYQWLRVTNISSLDFYYHQGETWQQAISANRSYNHDWYIDGGQVKYMMQTLVDTDSQPIDPTATIDPSTVNYHLD